MAILDIRGTIVLIDDADVHVVGKHAWFLNPQGYACTTLRVSPGKKGRKTIGMHRLILGDTPEAHIDHINRNKLDNRRENLLPCSCAENNRNKPTRKNKSSKHRGVSKNRDSWQVVLRVNGKLKWFGIYATEEEAALVAAPHFEGIAP